VWQLQEADGRSSSPVLQLPFNRVYLCCLSTASDRFGARVRRLRPWWAHRGAVLLLCYLITICAEFLSYGTETLYSVCNLGSREAENVLMAVVIPVSPIFDTISSFEL
jgi:hypothetical protein